MREPPIPQKHPRVFHEKPYWRGDSLRAIKRAKRRGYRYIDQNVNLTAGDPDAEARDERPVAVVKHWPEPRKDGFTRIVPERGRRREPHRMPRDQSIARLPWSVVSRLRRRVGSARYYRARTHMVVCADTGIILCAEVKGDRRFGHRQVMRDLRDDAKIAGGVVYVMTLQNLGDPLARLKAAKQEGFQTALLPRGPKPPDWETQWAPYIDAVWGRWVKG